MFPGRTNNQMLKLIMQLKGMVPNRVLKKSRLANLHFASANQIQSSNHMDGDMSAVGVAEKLDVGKSQIYFMSHEVDPISKLQVTKKMEFQVNSGQQSVNSLKAQLYDSGSSPEIRFKIDQLADLIDKCTEIVPEKRITPIEALKHSFFL
ncbi:Serine/threonine-protein kinase prp4 [Smittium mucronatum]|uniref:Serine/threonine-protein kinase prp4 n=1 Tax=Smittium mucronatum TaxID=133383 RepID=A0A1R0H7S0_9FUNG|nr:Serine/threonine-protein kinase prp4 [Smittium mucronatum]